MSGVKNFASDPNHISREIVDQPGQAFQIPIIKRVTCSCGLNGVLSNDITLDKIITVDF